VVEKNSNCDGAEVMAGSMFSMFGADYERYKKDLYISVQLYAARGFLRDDEAVKLEKIVDAIFENNDLIVMLPYNTKLTEEGKEVFVGKVTLASAKWVERRIEWIRREIEREYAKGFVRLTKELRQIKMEDFFQLDEIINKQEELLERVRAQRAGVSKGRDQKQTSEQYLSKKSIAYRGALKQAEDELVEILFKLNAFRDQYENDWYADLVSDQDAFMKKVDARRNMEHDRYDINSELSAFYRKTESANDVMKKVISAQKTLDVLHKQMDKVYDDLNNARKLLANVEKNFDATVVDPIPQKQGAFKTFKNMFSNRSVQKAEHTMKKALNDSKTLQKAIDKAQIEYENACDAWKTIVYGSLQKAQNESQIPKSVIN